MATSMDYKGLMWKQHHHRFGLAGEDQADLIQELLKRNRGRVLSVGVGCDPSGDKIHNLAEYCENLTAVDKSTQLISLARPRVIRSNVALLVADALLLPFAAGSFGDVLALGLFAHIEDPARVFSEFRRVCRSGAYVMVTNAVCHPKEQFRELGQAVGLRLTREHEGYCPVASGDVKRRYLLVFEVPDSSNLDHSH